MFGYLSNKKKISERRIDKIAEVERMLKALIKLLEKKHLAP
jgi:hypothetical protein